MISFLYENYICIHKQKPNQRTDLPLLFTGNEELIRHTFIIIIIKQ
ncbi:unnamed protein product, partial [Linum tenue]